VSLKKRFFARIFICLFSGPLWFSKLHLKWVDLGFTSHTFCIFFAPSKLDFSGPLWLSKLHLKWTDLDSFWRCISANRQIRTFVGSAYQADGGIWDANCRKLEPLKLELPTIRVRKTDQLWLTHKRVKGSKICLFS